MNKKKPCPHCGPLPINHFFSWLTDLITYTEAQFEKKFFYSTKGKRRFCKWGILSFTKNILSSGFIWLLEKLKIISFKTDLDRTKIYNRTLVLFDEAARRGIKAGTVLIFGRYNNQFFAEIDLSASPASRPARRAKRKIFFEGLPLGKKSHKIENLFIDDKVEIKKILRQNMLPFVEGKGFWIRSAGFKYGLHLGWPLVVKPRWGSVSRHVFLNICDEATFKQVISDVKKICPAFIVEKYLSGLKVYRATLVNFKLGGVVKRLPANVVGDGWRTIAQLVEEKNTHPWRGQAQQKDTTYLKIVINETSRNLLKQSGLDLSAVPAARQRVFLQEKIILDLGADLIEESKRVHPENVALFERVAEIFGAGVSGIDFLAQDIAVSWKEQKCAIIELNSLPFIDMHHFPLEGEPRNLAGMIWDMVLKTHNL